jgi:6-phosphogluconolactonase (cycloisomerase 2 family)
MRSRAILAVLTALIAVALVAAQAVSADDGRGQRDDDDDGGRGRESAVFVQTNELDGNRIVVFRRAGDGRLTEEDSYATGGNGGIATPGTESDRLASQGSLVYDERHRLLFAVNAGSDSISVFRVNGTRLRLTDVDPSGGDFPASIAVHKDLVYVLNAGGTGIVKGFEIRGNGVRALAGSERSLGLANTDPPDFLTSPGQVGFTPDGRKLIVTTKASRSTIDVFDVRRDGRLSDTAVVNPSATPVPFAFTFDPRGRLVMGEAAMSAVTTYTINGNGTLANPQSQSDNQVALCWIVEARGFFYVSNTGSNNLSGYRIDGNGRPTLIGPTGVVATTEEGPIDMATAAGGRFLYAQTGTGGTVDEFRVRDDGTLMRLGNVAGLPIGQEGIAAS